MAPADRAAAKAVGGTDANPADLERIARLIAEGRLTVPIAARFPMGRIRDVVGPPDPRHVQGEVVIEP